MAKNLEVILLLDFYGDMLTDNQRNFLGYYYNDDLSLSEIAQNEGITRQGVRDAVKRAENQLIDMEIRLGHAKRFQQVRRGLNEIIECTDNINDFNMRNSLSREVNDAVVRIKSIVSSLVE